MFGSSSIAHWDPLHLNTIPSSIAHWDPLQLKTIQSTIEHWGPLQLDVGAFQFNILSSSVFEREGLFTWTPGPLQLNIGTLGPLQLHIGPSSNEHIELSSIEHWKIGASSITY